VAGVGEKVGLLAAVESRLHRSPPRQQLVHRVRVLAAVETGSAPSAADEHGTHGHGGGAQDGRVSEVWRQPSQHSRHACDGTSRCGTLCSRQLSRC
jgi:hypothetical protein